MTSGTVTTVRRVRAATADPLRIVAAAAAYVHDWAAAAEGRRRTADVLQSLDRGAWRITRDIRLPDGGRAGHLAVGPSGAYLLDSNAWHGVVTVDHKGATITPEGRPTAAWTARGQHCSLAPAAAALGRAVSVAATASRPVPHAVVVIWAPFPEALALSGGITYVAGDHLVTWLSGQSRRPDHQVPRPQPSDDPPMARSLAPLAAVSPAASRT